MKHIFHKMFGIFSKGLVYLLQPHDSFNVWVFIAIFWSYRKKPSHAALGSLNTQH